MSNLLKQSQRLQSVPSMPIRHSKFNIPFGHTTTCNFGKLVPFYFSEVLPGSTFEISTNILARMSTPLHPVMGNANLDYMFFFVPNRLVWDHWPNFCGENTEGAWAPEVSYEIPHMSVTPTVGDCYDHFGIKPGVTQDIGVLPLRAYRLIWNEWFRDENIQDPLLVNKGDTETDTTYANLCDVNRYPDMFSTCLPAPQKGQPVELSLIGNAPVITGEDHLSMGAAMGTSLRWVGSTSTWPDSVEDAGGFYLQANLNQYGRDNITVAKPNDDGNANAGAVVPANLWADMSQVSATTVAQLRDAFATQRVLEAFARVGSRYTEMLRGIFNVISPDARLQRPEYLGGDRARIEMSSIVQSSSTVSGSPQGNAAGYSKTVTGGKNFTHTFTEHGLVIGVLCARVLHTYQDGLERYWSKRDFFDFYLPQTAHISEQPVRNKEIYVQGNADDDKVFGYQEAWYEYRNKPSIISSYFRSGINGSLDMWHYADHYTSLPTLSDAWIREGKNEVDRTLAVDSSEMDQLLIDIYMVNKATLPLPVYSVPGLIDHF